MQLLFDYYPLIIYVILFGSLKICERVILTSPESKIRKSWNDWTVWLILIPLWMVLIGPIIEYVVLFNRPEVWEMVLGGALFIGAGFFSIKGYLDLEQGFMKAIEIEESSLVVNGLYKAIRHPISLGNILFCLACPLFLAAGPSWIPALIGIFGVILRISIEESFMQLHIRDYQAYKERTWAMIPYIY